MSPPPQLSPSRVRTHEDAWSLVRSVEPSTRLEAAQGLSTTVPGSPVLLKREDLGPNGSFKWRGALCAVSDLADAGAKQIVTASTGNHGAATAWAAKMFGLTAHVVVPVAASGIKCALIEENGAVLHPVGADLAAAAVHARSLADKLDAPYFEDGASSPQILGAATIGQELADAKPAVVIVPVAVGALAAGLAVGLAAVACYTDIYGVQAEGFDAISRRLRGAPSDPRPGAETFADGLADNRIVDPAFTLCRKNLRGVVVVSESALERAVIDLGATEGIVAEGAGAAALAGLRELQLDLADERPTVLVISGRNLEPDVAQRLLG